MAKIDYKYAFIPIVSFLFLASCAINDQNQSLNSANMKYGSNQILLKNINLPDNFQIDIFADDLGKSLNLPGPNNGVRFMEFYNDVLFVSIPSAGRIIALPDKNKDGKADELIKVIDELNRPHGIAFLDDYMYIANDRN